MFKIIHGLPMSTVFVGTISNANLSYSDGLFGKHKTIELNNNIKTLEIICGKASDEISIDMLLESGERIIAVCDAAIYRILYAIWKRY